MILPLILYPDELLKQVSQPVNKVNKELVQFGKDLVETMLSHKALGLSAVQVGKLINVVCIMKNKAPILMYNPKILMRENLKKPFRENCLSFPGVSYLVKRPNRIKVQYTNINNKKEFLFLEGLDAIVLLHEYDHCSGVTFDTVGEKIK